MSKRKYHHLSDDERMHFHLVRAFYAWALGDAWEAYRQQCYALAALRDVNAFRLTTSYAHSKFLRTQARQRNG